jgi:DNA primase
MLYGNETVEAVRQANPIEDVVGQYIQLRNNKGLCPFHDDKKPSFSVHPKKGIAKCFACMPHAVDVFGFIMLMEKVSFPEAVKILADRSGVDLPDFSEEDRQVLEKQKKRERILEETANFYHSQLMSVLKLENGKEAL